MRLQDSVCAVGGRGGEAGDEIEGRERWEGGGAV